LISIKVPEALLSVFRNKAMQEDVPYQTKIKSLMTDWVLRGNSQ
jgi:predicted DNA binding CopG/RHH family protein